MAPRDEMANIYNRICALERHQTMVETRLPELDQSFKTTDTRIAKLETWQVEVKILVAKWIGFYGAIAVIGNLVITAAIQYWLTNHPK